MYIPCYDPSEIRQRSVGHESTSGASKNALEPRWTSRAKGSKATGALLPSWGVMDWKERPYLYGKCIHIYICTVYIYIYICIEMYVYIYIYVYTVRLF